MSIAQPINTNSVAFIFGQRDALRNEPCVPEMIFIARKQQIDYCAGFETVKGVTLTTAQFTREPLGCHIDVAAELEEQIEGRLDNEYWATGQW